MKSEPTRNRKSLVLREVHGERDPQDDRPDDHHEPPGRPAGPDVLDRDCRRVDVGERVVGLIAEEQGQAGGPEGDRQDRADQVVAGQDEDEQHAERIEADVGDGEARDRPHESGPGVPRESVVVGHERQPADGHDDDQVDGLGERQAPVTRPVDRRAEVEVRDDVDRHPGRGGEDDPDPGLLEPLADDDERAAQAHQDDKQAPGDGPGRVGPRAHDRRGQASRGLGHDDDLEGAEPDQLDHVDEARQVAAADPEARPETRPSTGWRGRCPRRRPARAGVSRPACRGRSPPLPARTRGLAPAACRRGAPAARHRGRPTGRSSRTRQARDGGPGPARSRAGAAARSSRGASTRLGRHQNATYPLRPARPAGRCRGAGGAARDSIGHLADDRQAPVDGEGGAQVVTSRGSTVKSSS